LVRELVAPSPRLPRPPAAAAETADAAPGATAGAVAGAAAAAGTAAGQATIAAGEAAGAAPAGNGLQVRRTFPPGSEWLFAKLYTGTATADRVLRDVLAPLVRE